ERHRLRGTQDELIGRLGRRQRRGKDEDGAEADRMNLHERSPLSPRRDQCITGSPVCCLGCGSFAWLTDSCCPSRSPSSPPALHTTPTPPSTSPSTPRHRTSSAWRTSRSASPAPS